MKSGKEGGTAGSSRAENMIWISRIRGFAAQTPNTLQCTKHTPVHTSAVHQTDTTDTSAHHSLLQPAFICIALHALSLTLHRTAAQRAYAAQLVRS